MRWWHIALVGIAHGAMAGTIRVCDTCRFQSIAGAIAQANKGDTVLVYPGVYRESNIQVDKSLYVVGINYPRVDVQQQGYGFVLKGDSITLKGFEIYDVEQSYVKEYAAVLVRRCTTFVVEDLRIRRAFFGILAEKSSSGVIRDNRISGVYRTEADAGNGIHLWHCKHMRIEGNVVHHMRDGIYFEFVSRSVIEHNHSHDNVRYGLHFMFSNNDEYHDNIFERNGAGVAVMFSKYIHMRRNVFRDNWGVASYGLLLKEIYDATITDNHFIRNTIGINIDGSTRIRYERNLFQANGWAVRILGASYQNDFSENNFLHNTFDVAFSGRETTVRFVRNYWSDYTGYDLDRDGYGDVPYRPVKLFSYIVNQVPEAMVLLRSLFVGLINFSEKVSPVFTPDNLVDSKPAMRAYDIEVR